MKIITIITILPQKKEMNDEEAVMVFNRIIKQTEESIVEYKAAGRQDLVDRESQQLEVMKEFRDHVKECSSEQ